MNTIVATIHTHLPRRTDRNARDRAKHILFVLGTCRTRSWTFVRSFLFLSLWSCVIIVDSITNTARLDQIVLDRLLIPFQSSNIVGQNFDRENLLVPLCARNAQLGQYFDRMYYQSLDCLHLHFPRYRRSFSRLWLSFYLSSVLIQQELALAPFQSIRPLHLKLTIYGVNIINIVIFCTALRL